MSEESKLERELESLTAEITIERQVSYLVNTSVDDCKSTLRCARLHGGTKMEVLQAALAQSVERGNVTRSKIIGAEIRWQEKKNGRQS